jgi:hypothetical protein
MLVKKTLAVAGLLTVMGGVAACGGSSSSTGAGSTSGSSDGPTTASKTTFCGTFEKLSSSSTPKDVAAALSTAGTPSDIDASSRHGFEVLVEHLKTLPDNAKSKDLKAMEKGLSKTDEQDVLAFSTYLTKECVPTASASGQPSVPSSPSS